MELKSIKGKGAPVVKAIKGNFINLTRVIKGAKGEESKTEDITVLTVVDQDGDTVETFRKSDHGPRFWFKAKQFADQNSSLDQRLTVKELE
jgi:hypothetical protein